MLELLKRRGVFGVHAAGVALHGRGIALAGTSGSGKTTLALALALAGFDLLGDDMLFLRAESGEPVLLAFPDELDVSETTVSFFPQLRRGSARTRSRALPSASWIPPRWGPPSSQELARRSCSSLKSRRAARAPLSLSRSTSALLELAPNVLLTEPSSSQRHLDALGALVRAGRCFRLTMGRDFDQVTTIIRQLLEERA